MDDIKDTLAELVGEIAPDVRLVPKYGGVVMCPNEGDDKTFAGGIFHLQGPRLDGILQRL